jgi:hypothetical protein
MHDKISASGSFPHPQSLSRREREEKPFSSRDTLAQPGVMVADRYPPEPV